MKVAALQRIRSWHAGRQGAPLKVAHVEQRFDLPSWIAVSQLADVVEPAPEVISRDLRLLESGVCPVCGAEQPVGS